MRYLMAGTLIVMLGLPIIAAAEEYNGTCAYGLSEYGVVVETDCKINWQDLKTGKTYCFSSEQSKESFLRAPEENIIKASENFSKVGRQ